jgi:hypothetical protein
VPERKDLCSYFQSFSPLTRDWPELLHSRFPWGPSDFPADQSVSPSSSAYYRQYYRQISSNDAVPYLPSFVGNHFWCISQRRILELKSSVGVVVVVAIIVIIITTTTTTTTTGRTSLFEP